MTDSMMVMYFNEIYMTEFLCHLEYWSFFLTLSSSNGFSPLKWLLCFLNNPKRKEKKNLITEGNLLVCTLVIVLYLLSRWILIDQGRKEKRKKLFRIFVLANCSCHYFFSVVWNLAKRHTCERSVTQFWIREALFFSFKRVMNGIDM